MSRKQLSPTTRIILSTILIIITCLGCGTYPGEKFEELTKAKVPIYLPELEPTTATPNYKVALNFGIAASDALAAVFDEDQAVARRYMGMIHDYAKKLGLPGTFLDQLGKINIAIEQGDWNRVRQLSADFGEQFLKEMEKAGKNDEGNLALVAFDLEGVYIAAKSVNNRFSPESAKLLSQTGFAEDHLKRLEALSLGLKNKKEVKNILAALPKINQIVDRPANYLYSQTDIQDLIGICEPLRRALLRD